MGLEMFLLRMGKILEFRVKSSESGVKDNSKLKTQNSKLRIIDATGLCVSPRVLLIMHTHLRERDMNTRKL